MKKNCKLCIVNCVLLIALCAIGGCCQCEVEPIIEQNQKLIVPPDFGKRP